MPDKKMQTGGASARPPDQGDRDLPEVSYSIQRTVDLQRIKEMKLSQKKNCNGCRAGWANSQPFEQICWFGYQVKSPMLEGVPQEPCYKPLTIAGYLMAAGLRRADLKPLPGGQL